MKRTFLFATIASILSINAYAVSATVTSKDYVDNTFQTKIPAKSTASEYSSASLVEETGTPGSVSERKIFDHLVDWDTDPDGDSSFYSGNVYSNDDYDEIIPSIPTVGAVIDSIDIVANRVQSMIAASGYGVMDGINKYTENDPTHNSLSWLNARVKGTGLVTKTSIDGDVGERKIIETEDVANYGTGTAIQQQIQEISIPTMGAVMAAISNNQVTLPTGTAGNVVTYNSNGVVGGSVATYTGAAAYNATNDSGKIPTMAGVATYAQAKKTCAGWMDGTTTPDATHTDANCVLWNLPG